jgi:hypothetical protein
MQNGNRELVTDIALGAAAGALATWVMGQVTTLLYEHEDEEAREREDEARDGSSAFGVAAGKIAGLFRRELSDAQQQALGSKLHYALGIGTGASYAVLRHHVPRADALQGTAFGTVFWLLVDEGANPALGFTPGPRRFPWQTHARGLAGHVVFGAVLDTILDGADRVRERFA